MPKPKSPWTDYTEGLRKRAQKTSAFFTANYAEIPWKSIGLMALSPYFYESMKTDKNGEPVGYIAAKSGGEIVKTSNKQELAEIPVRQAISPWKLLNPFKLVEAGLTLVQFSVGKLIDQATGHTLADRKVSMTARIAKSIMAPLALANLLICPFSTLERTPYLKKAATKLGIQGPLEKKEQEASSTQTTATKERSSEALILDRLESTANKPYVAASKSALDSKEPAAEIKSEKRVKSIIEKFEQELRLHPPQSQLAELKQRREQRQAANAEQENDNTPSPPG